MNHRDRSNQAREITNRFMRLFRGRADAWGAVYGRCMREQVHQRNYYYHLTGKTSLGIYPLLDNGTTWFGAVDVDKDDLELTIRIREELWSLGLKPTFIERSKSKGYHIWVFFSEPVNAKDVRSVLMATLRKLDLEIEVFPKQDMLREGEIGNYINLPYFGGLKATPERRVVLDTKTYSPVSLQEFTDQAERSRLQNSDLQLIIDELESTSEKTPEKVVKPTNIPEIDIERLELHEKVKKLITGDFTRTEDGLIEVTSTDSVEAAKYTSRSEADQAIISALLSKGHTEPVIFAVFEKYPTTGKYKDKGKKKDQYLSKSIENSKKFIEKHNEDLSQKKHKQRYTYVASLEFKDGKLLEMVYVPEKNDTKFAVYHEGEVSYENRLIYTDGNVLSPYSSNNNLIKHEVVLLPSHAEPYGTERQLIEEVKQFIHTYVDVSPLFEEIAAYYVLFSWIYDDFRELPYLRVIGDPGSGKTRFLLTVGSLCYKPIFAGTSTISPLFRILDTFRGTLIIDEGDFRMSDEKAEIVKILNNGNAKGFPVLRSETVKGKEFSPKAYSVFGPKIVATRGFFQDSALESRCITEEMGQRKLRDDIPINLTDEHKRQTQKLRNKLLMFRFYNVKKRTVDPSLVDRTIEPRLNQVFVPLLSVIEDENARSYLKNIAKEYHRQIIADRGMKMEAQVLEIIKTVAERGDELSIKEVTDNFVETYGEDYEKKITPKWIGSIIGKKLKLKTEKRRDGFVIPSQEKEKLLRLYEKYGVSEKAADKG